MKTFKYSQANKHSKIASSFKEVVLDFYSKQSFLPTFASSDLLLGIETSFFVNRMGLGGIERLLYFIVLGRLSDLLFSGMLSS